MKSALVSTSSVSLFTALESAFSKAGFIVEAAASQADVLEALRKAQPAALIRETPRTSFAELMQASFRIRPDMPVYLLDGGAVFCRYPFATRQPDIVAALRSAGVRVADWLIGAASQDAKADDGDDAFLV
jgi:DNA-binding NtrC family response regulator